MEALWRPYVDQAGVDARFHLADFYLNYVYDDGSQKEMEMKELLSRAADEGHADATYRLRQQYPAGAERDALLLKAGEPGSLEAQRDLGALYATGDWLRRPADQEDECAIRLLADVYRNGKYGVSADAVEAELWQGRYRKTELYLLRVQRWGEDGA